MDEDPGRYATEWRGVLGDRRMPKGGGIFLALILTILSVAVAMAAYLDAVGL